MPRPGLTFLALFSLALSALGLPSLDKWAEAASREAPVEPAHQDYAGCPLLATDASGGVALAWSRFDGVAAWLLSTVAGPQGELAPATLVDRHTESLLLPLSLAPGPSGYRLLWDRFPYPVEVLVANEIAPDGVIQGPPRVLGSDGHGAVGWTHRPGRGYVASWPTPKGLSVQLRDDQGRAEGGIAQIPLPGVRLGSVLFQADGSFLIVLLQTVAPEGLQNVLRLQRFTAAGRPAGPLVRLPLDLYLFGRHIAVLGPEGTLAITVETPNSLVLRTFTSDGRPLGRTIEIPRSADRPLLATEALAIDPTGNLLWIWSAARDPLDPEATRAREFSRTGEPLGPAFRLATRASAARPVVACASAISAGGGWAVAWVGERIEFGDGSRLAQLYFRRFLRDPGEQSP